jgi:hypothetical protein
MTWGIAARHIASGAGGALQPRERRAWGARTAAENPSLISTIYVPLGPSVSVIVG